jgi:hypothetical protein
LPLLPRTNIGHCGMVKVHRCSPRAGVMIQGVTA